QCDGFVCQAMQRVVFQWRPEANAVTFVNVFDLLSQAGKDEWLQNTRQTPRPKTWNDAGLPWDQVRQQHLAVLEQYPDLGSAYYGVAGDPVDMNGLPVADVTQVGDALVLRAQRVVLQQWLVDKPWAKSGEVTFALGGDIAKDAGLLPKAALVQMTATTRSRGNITMTSPLPPVPVVQDDLDAAKKVFVVYALMNAGGYDDDNARGFSTMRQRVREAVAATQDRGLLDRVRTYYQRRSNVLFSTFGSYAMALSGSGPFAETDNTPAALQGTAPLLNEFYTKARIGALWDANKSEVQAHLRDIMPRFVTPAQEVFDYSQWPSLPAQSYVYVPNYLEAYGRASTSKLDDKRYIMEGPSFGATSHINTFRHEVAHSVVNPVVEENLDLVESKRALFRAAPAEVKRYYRDWATFVAECLVRAVTVRVADLSTPTPGTGEAMRKADMERGFFLVGPFVEQLKAYETSGMTLREYAPKIFEAME
ncbi:MAG: DUF4932 domain-containing protein, partial [Chloroflexi bacterium]|nr:DUF4932 domain-containing protein [Chloroflexota bacterium]